MKMDLVAPIRLRKPFFISFFALLFSGIIYLYLSGGDVTFPVNSQFPFLVNVFLINVTFMGDAVFAVCLAFTLYFYYKRRKVGLAVFISFVITEIAVQLFKNGQALEAGGRIYFEDGQTKFFNNAELAGINSGTVSGHTAIAFALATVLMLMLKQARWQWPLLAGAILLSYSRIYLAGHQLSDILIAALQGTVSGLLSFYLVNGLVTVRVKRKSQTKPVFSSPLTAHELTNIPGNVATI